MTKSLTLVLVVLAASSVSASGSEQKAPCPMAPRHTVIQIPMKNLIWIDGVELFGSCEALPETAWSESASRSRNIRVHADGPSGSGRYWVITLGLLSEGATVPVRGFCLKTSTVGWRTLQRYHRIPLPWLEDLDKDGVSEFLLWDSFPLREEPTMAEFALVAWVYDIGSDGVLRINWDLSRTMAADIAMAYREPLKGALNRIASRRDKASDVLQRFATEQCSSVAELDR